jgi:type 1 glutamine amidotransferase
VNKIKTLLLTGANNHDWRRSAPFCKELLEKSGKFEVDLTETPATALADAAALRKYQLLFSDYNGPDWGEPAKTNFEAAVRGGTGLVVLHAADNAFRGWVEYERMAGLMWREGTSHGAYHEFEVTIIDHWHPITKGLSNFRLWDELYHKLVHMHGVDFRILASAYSDPATKGTGRHEPVMAVQQYGKGRVYHHVLGHVWPGDPAKGKGMTMTTFENEGFQKSLLRGCEWAATGSVTE